MIAGLLECIVRSKEKEKGTPGCRARTPLLTRTYNGGEARRNMTLGVPVQRARAKLARRTEPGTPLRWEPRHGGHRAIGRASTGSGERTAEARGGRARSRACVGRGRASPCATLRPMRQRQPRSHAPPR